MHKFWALSPSFARLRTIRPAFCSKSGHFCPGVLEASSAQASGQQDVGDELHPGISQGQQQVSDEDDAGGAAPAQAAAVVQEQ